MYDESELEVGFLKLIASSLKTLFSLLFCLRKCGIYVICVVEMLYAPIYSAKIHSYINIF